VRVVSLVPSLTEAVAVSAPGLLVGATDYCAHPADLDVPRVGGSKYPSVEAILALSPDLVLANQEENREADVDALRSAGVEVWVTFPCTVPAALDTLRELLAALSAPNVGWLSSAAAAWASVEPGPSRRAVIPVWRRPWVVIGGGTFAGDVLSRLGIVNAFSSAPERYPRPTLDEIRSVAPDLVVLPDEPYEFSASDGPECFPGTPYALVSGRHLTWYGPSLVSAPAVLRRQLTG
jgi:ABC-type Fe3+-hydroxamate transport system substrate-binding protein